MKLKAIVPAFVATSLTIVAVAGTVGAISISTYLFSSDVAKKIGEQTIIQAFKAGGVTEYHGAPLFYGLTSVLEKGPQIDDWETFKIGTAVVKWPDLINVTRDQVGNNPKAVNYIFDHFTREACEGLNSGLAKIVKKYPDGLNDLKGASIQDKLARALYIDIGPMRQFAKGIHDQTYIQNYVELVNGENKSWGLSQAELAFKNSVEGNVSYEDIKKVIGKVPSWYHKSDDGVEFMEYLNDMTFEFAKNNKSFSKSYLDAMSANQLKYYNILLKFYSARVKTVAKVDPSFPQKDEEFYIEKLYDSKSGKGFLIRRCVQAQNSGKSCQVIVDAWMSGAEKMLAAVKNNCQ